MSNIGTISAIMELTFSWVESVQGIELITTQLLFNDKYGKSYEVRIHLPWGSDLLEGDQGIWLSLEA